MSWPTNYPDDDTKLKESRIAAPSPTGLLKDFTVGFTLAVKNILSYGLAMLGILFVTLILMVTILLLIVIPILITMGLPFLIWL
ncbi:MAG: hypothetical protein ACFFDQ_11730, partial [Candidatus Thorarchaeota archaeon]